jgi:hypothetical protein
MRAAFTELLGKSGKGRIKKNIAIHAFEKGCKHLRHLQNKVHKFQFVTAWITTEHAFSSSCGLQNHFLLPHASSSSCGAKKSNINSHFTTPTVIY